MKSNQKRKAPPLPYAWGDLQANARGIDMLEPQANRLAFTDPEFLLRRAGGLCQNLGENTDELLQGLGG